jgi:CheY-like chemotaxis protein
MRGAMMKKILVVDDEENIRLLYQEELEEEGYTVEMAAHGQEALEKVNAFQPDLVTLDIRMPGMDGVETLRKIREVQRDLPVILCSAYGEYKQDLTTWASDAYVIKTSDLTELKATIRTLLSKD